MTNENAILYKLLNSVMRLGLGGLWQTVSPIVILLAN